MVDSSLDTVYKNHLQWDKCHAKWQQTWGVLKNSLNLKFFGRIVYVEWAQHKSLWWTLLKWEVYQRQDQARSQAVIFDQVRCERWSRLAEIYSSKKISWQNTKNLNFQMVLWRKYEIICFSVIFPEKIEHRSLSAYLGFFLIEHLSFLVVFSTINQELFDFLWKKKRFTKSVAPATVKSTKAGVKLCWTTRYPMSGVAAIRAVQIALGIVATLYLPRSSGGSDSIFGLCFCSKLEKFRSIRRGVSSSWSSQRQAIPRNIDVTIISTLPQ